VAHYTLTQRGGKSVRSQYVTNALLVVIVTLLTAIVLRSPDRPITAYDLMPAERREELSEEARDRLRATYFVRITNTVEIEGEVDVRSVYDTVTVEF